MRTAIRIAFSLLLIAEIVGTFFFAELRADFTWLGLFVTGLFVWGAAEAFRLSSKTLWLIFAVAVLDGLSALFQLYSRIHPWDLFMHAVGGFTIAAAALDLVLRSLREQHVSARRHVPFIIATVLLTVATIGFLYELWEYLVDRFQYGYPKSLVSAYDSIEDQMMNLFGATTLLAAYFTRRGRASR